MPDANPEETPPSAGEITDGSGGPSQGSCRRHAQGNWDPTGPVRIPTAAPWARQVGYCRALRAGDRILVSGTAPVNPDGSTHAPHDAYRQMKRCLQIIEEALSELGGSLDQVVRTRIYVTDISRWEELGRAHGEVFAEHPPVNSMVEVRALISPDMLLEVEAEAWIASPP